MSTAEVTDRKRPCKHGSTAKTRWVRFLLVSLLAAISSLGMYTLIAPLLAATGQGLPRSTTPYLWFSGVGGVSGRFLIGPLLERIKGPLLTLWIMAILAVALLVLPATAARTPGW